MDAFFSHLLPYWGIWSARITSATTIICLSWQFFAPKGTSWHTRRWFIAFSLNVFATYMNTLMTDVVPVGDTNPWRIATFGIHGIVGLCFDGTMIFMPILGYAYRIRKTPGLIRWHKYIAYAVIASWTIANIASEIGAELPLH